MNNKINIKMDIDMTNLFKEMALIKSKTETIEYAIKLLLSDKQKEELNQMADFFLYNNFSTLFEQSSDFDKDSADYIEIKNKLTKLDSELTEKGLLQP